MPSDTACADGICVLTVGSNVILAKGKNQIVKPIRYLTTEKSKSQIYRDLELDDLEDAEEIVIEILNRRSQVERKVKEETEETEPKEFLPECKEKALLLLKQPDILEKFIQHSNKWLVMDEPTRKIELLTCISALGTYPINLSLQQTWSSGKTTTIVATSKYFESQDVWSLAGLTPKGLIHQRGVYDTEKEAFIVNMEKKILIFLDEPQFETLITLKPLLSRDKYEITYKYVDANMETVTSILRGFPSAVFCSVKSKYTEEFTSRWLTASPSTDPTKIRKVLQQKADRKTSPEKYEEDEEFYVWQKAFNILKEQFPIKVVVPFAKTFEPFFRAKRPVDMRFFDLFMALIEATTILHAYQRQKDDKERLIATSQDYEIAYSIFKEIEKPTVYGVGQDVLDFYETIILPCTENNAFTNYQELARKYIELYETPINQNHMHDHFLTPLEAKGLVSIDTDPTDKRRKLISASGALPQISLIDNEGYMEETRN